MTTVVLWASLFESHFWAGLGQCFFLHCWQNTFSSAHDMCTAHSASISHAWVFFHCCHFLLNLDYNKLAWIASLSIFISVQNFTHPTERQWMIGLVVLQTPQLVCITLVIDVPNCTGNHTQQQFCQGSSLDLKSSLENSVPQKTSKICRYL